MIFAKGSVVNIEGTPIEIGAELTAIIMGVQTTLERKVGKEMAKKMIVVAGRAAYNPPKGVKQTMIDMRKMEEEGFK